MEEMRSVQSGEWKVTVVSDEYLRFKNVVTGVTGRIRLEHGSVDSFDGVDEFPVDVYRCLRELGIYKTTNHK